ncbi:MAG: nucleotidyltransferase domain-containing protein [Beijerinckiaceae bacterium]
MSLADPLSKAPLVRPNIGQYADEAAALAGVVARLVEALDPQAIWLFGSRARGDHRPDSDFDLLVVAKENGGFGSNDYVKAYRATVGLGLDCEVVPCSHEDFEDALTTHTSFVSQIVAHGQQVFEARP